MVKNISESVRRDFEVFARGVERLEQIREELRNLNTGGHEAEISSIKSKLNNVSYIPEIEKELIDLKAKINGAHKNKKDSSKAHAVIHKKINELKEKIPKTHSNIHRKIDELRGIIPNKEKIYGKINELEKEVKKVKEMPNIKNQLKHFKDFIGKQKKEEERKKEILKKIYPKSNFGVNDKFNLTLKEIKAELYEKIHKRELDIQKQLHDDLENRKLNFKRQYEALEKNFEKKYRGVIKKRLKKEVKDKFDKVLGKRISVLKKNLENRDNKILKLEKRKLMDKEKERMRELNLAKKYLRELKEKFKESGSEKLKNEEEKLKGLEKQKLN
ncbi:MAG: hypothetical protein AABW90_02260, partial [Nanoarchaeota archaeon]